MAKILLETPFRPELLLKRYPFDKNDLLQAWDSADELILEHLHEMGLQDQRILIINDQFGALGCALENFGPVLYTDSFVSAEGTRINSQGRLTVVSELKKIEGSFDLVLLKFPKNMSFLEDILCHLTPHLKPDTQIICGVMVKHLAKSSFELLEKYIGPTTTSLAKKKARLVFSQFQGKVKPSPYPLLVSLDGFSEPFLNHSNLFSREKLDVGTRFLLENMPRGNFKKVLDLGCANGVIGIKARELYPEARLIFSDESFMAIISAKANYEKRFADEATYVWTNCFENQPEKEFDLVLCNPPFHQQTTVGDFIAWQMFSDAYQALKKGGVIRVIGNSHLGYHVKLKKLFGESKIIATNQKFMIIDAYKA